MGRLNVELGRVSVVFLYLEQSYFPPFCVSVRLDERAVQRQPASAAGRPRRESEVLCDSAEGHGHQHRSVFSDDRAVSVPGFQCSRFSVFQVFSVPGVRRSDVRRWSAGNLAAVRSARR